MNIPNMNRHLLKQAKLRAEEEFEELKKYPGGKELYAFPDGMDLEELITALSKIKEEHGGDIPVFFRTNNYFDVKATGLRWDGLTREDVWEKYDYDLPSAVIVRLNDY